MVEEAKKYMADDVAQEESIKAKNSLESYALNMKKTLEDGEVDLFCYV